MLNRIIALANRHICRGCGTEIMYPGKYRKCPVCGIHLG